MRGGRRPAGGQTGRIDRSPRPPLRSASKTTKDHRPDRSAPRHRRSRSASADRRDGKQRHRPVAFDDAESYELRREYMRQDLPIPGIKSSHAVVGDDGFHHRLGNGGIPCSSSPGNEMLGRKPRYSDNGPPPSTMVLPRSPGRGYTSAFNSTSIGSSGAHPKFGLYENDVLPSQDRLRGAYNEGDKERLYSGDGTYHMRHYGGSSSSSGLHKEDFVGPSSVHIEGASKFVDDPLDRNVHTRMHLAETLQRPVSPPTGDAPRSYDYDGLHSRSKAADGLHTSDGMHRNVSWGLQGGPGESMSYRFVDLVEDIVGGPEAPRRKAGASSFWDEHVYLPQDHHDTKGVREDYMGGYGSTHTGLEMRLLRDHEHAPYEGSYEFGRDVGRERLRIPMLRDREGLQSPVLPDRERLRGPMLPDRERLRSPVLPDRGRLRSPILADRGRLRSPMLADRGRLRSPMLPERERHRSPMLPDRERLRSPMLLGRERLRSPIFLDRERLRSPVLPDRERFGSPILSDRRMDAFRHSYSPPRGVSHREDLDLYYDQLPERMIRKTYALDSDIDGHDSRSIFSDGRDSFRRPQALSGDEEPWYEYGDDGSELVPSRSLTFGHAQYRAHSGKISGFETRLRPRGSSPHPQHGRDMSLKRRLRPGLPEFHGSLHSKRNDDSSRPYKFRKRGVEDQPTGKYAHGDDVLDGEMLFVKSDPPEYSEEFKKQVNKTFLRFIKFLYGNPFEQKRYREPDKSGILICCVCGSLSKEFANTHRLVTHTYRSLKAGLRTKHLGLHKALCVLMGWNWLVPPENPRAYQFSPPEAKSVREDLILWPPIVIIHNSSIGSKSTTNALKIITNEGMKTILTEMGFEAGKIQICRGKPANRSVFLVKFMPTFSGLQEAERLDKYYVDKSCGRKEFQQLSCCKNSSENVGAANVEKADELLYGYIAIAEDLDKIEPGTKKRCLVKSKRDIEAIADAPLNAE